MPNHRLSLPVYTALEHLAELIVFLRDIEVLCRGVFMEPGYIGSTRLPDFNGEDLPKHFCKAYFIAPIFAWNMPSIPPGTWCSVVPTHCLCPNRQARNLLCFAKNEAVVRIATPILGAYARNAFGAGIVWGSICP